jgi:hypothetical protein
MYATKFGFAGAMGAQGTTSGAISSCWDVPTGVNGGAFFGYVAATNAPTQTSASGGWLLAPTLSQATTGATWLNAMPMAYGIGGLQVSLCDASCRVIYPSMSYNTWNTALQPNDGLPPGSDW